MENILNITTREQLRNWLELNSSTEKCCWIIISIKQKPDTLLYLDAVKEALCFGWIDGIKKKYSEDKLIQRLSPRVRIVHGQNSISSVCTALNAWGL